MDFPAVQQQLNDLPPTFLRSNATWLQWMDALSAGLARFTIGADGVAAQGTFANARFGWLDVWGLLFGIPRMANEADSKYSTRIVFTLNTGAGTVLVMQEWIALVYNLFVAITDSATAFGYTITFPPIATSDQINAVLSALGQVRPAGVPFIAYSQNIGTYLDTVNYLNASLITGSYLGGGSSSVALTIGAATNNSTPLFPQLFLTDPVLNK